MPTVDEINAWIERKWRDGAELDPFLLATIYLIVKELNELRALHGLPLRTKDQVFTAIRNQMDDFTQD